jgi:hypothetical protein
MSTFINRVVVAAQNRVAGRGEEGQAVAEYGTVVLVAVALGMAVLSLFTGGVFDTVLHKLTETALNAATKLIK